MQSMHPLFLQLLLLWLSVKSLHGVRFGDVADDSHDYIPGVLKSFRKDTGYGFITCDVLEKDVYFPASQLPRDGQPEVGCAVQVSVVFNAKGQPQAEHVIWAPSLGRAQEGKRYSGTLKSVGAKAYGRKGVQRPIQ